MIVAHIDQIPRLPEDMNISLFSQSLFALPLVEAIEGTAASGFSALELACQPPHFDLETARRDPQSIAGRIRDCGLQVSALSLFNNFTDPAGLDRQLEEAEVYIRLAPLFNTELLKLTPGPPGSAEAAAVCWDTLAAALDRLTRLAAEVGVRLAFETHMRQLTDTLAGAERLLALAPSDTIGLTIDFSNLAFAGERMPAVVGALGDRIYNTHIKNGTVSAEGSWHFHALDRGMTDYAEVLALLDAFVAAGGTLLDSGRIYGDSEEILGRWMESRGTRDRMVLITKGAHGEGVIPADYPQVLREELDTSLQQLRTDCIDLLMLHRDNQMMPVADILGPLNEVIATGQIRAIGASNWEYRRLTQAGEYADKHGLQGFSAISNNISLAVPTAAFFSGLVSTDREGERWHRETGIPLIPWSSQARGFFAGACPRPQRDNPGPEDGFTRRMLEVYGTDENFERLDRAQQLGVVKGGFAAVEVALAWLLHKPFPLVPVVGPRNPAELASCVRATSLALTPAEIQWLNLEI